MTVRFFREQSTSIILRPSALFLVIAMLNGCTPLPKIDVSRLEERERIDVDVRIEKSALVYSDARTLTEGAKAGASAASNAAADAVFSDELAVLWLTVGPTVVPMAAIVGAGVGATAATTETRASIDTTVSNLRRSFRPKSFERSAEDEFVEALIDVVYMDDRHCVASARSLSGCPMTRDVARIFVDMSFDIVPGRSRASSGELDFLGSTTVWAEPEGALVPDCIRWAFRQPAGNLFKLTQNDSELISKVFSSFVHEVSRRLPSELFAHGSSAIPGVPKYQSRWTRTRCKNVAPEVRRAQLRSTFP